MRSSQESAQQARCPEALLTARADASERGGCWNTAPGQVSTYCAFKLAQTTDPAGGRFGLRRNQAQVTCRDLCHCIKYSP